MCKAMKDHDKEIEVLVSIRTTKKYVKDENEIIKAVADDCNVDSSFVRDLLMKTQITSSRSSSGMM